MKIRFCGAIQDTSGYGEFARYFVYALNQAGHDVSVEPIMVDPKPNMDFGKKGTLCKTLQKGSRRPDVNIINMIPMFFKKFSLPNCKNIGFTMWETTKLPDSWVEACNAMDAIFVPCKWNVDVFRESGVTVPIHVVYPGMDLEEVPELTNPKEKTQNKFHFYSIFQWIERKHPLGLIKSYFSEFTGVEDVVLTLKTYRHARIKNNQQVLVNEIQQIKKDLKLKHYPEIHLLTDFLSHEQMTQIHRKFHCFVLPHRSEGFGMPHMDAMSYGNPTIATNFSGNTDFMRDDNSYLIPYQLTPACGMSWYVPWYDGTMYWAEPNLHALAKTMRHVYENRDEAVKKGIAGRNFIMENFNPTRTANMLVDACEKVMKGIK